jgi:branched-chain amino acid transport system substrate-binding protein
MLRLRIHLTGLLLISLLLAACVSTATPAASTQAPAATSAATAAQSSVIKIGSLFPLTGSLAPTGVASRDAVLLAVEIINGDYPDLNLPLAAGEGLPNLGGAKVEVVFADHQMDPEKGASETERLITEEGIVAVVGAYASSVSATSSQVTERYGIPFVNDQSTSTALHTRGFKWYFRTTPHDGMFSEAIFQFLQDMRDTKGVDISTVATIFENTQYGSGSSRSQNELAAQYGFEVVANVAYPSGTADMTAEVQSLKAANPDIVLPSSYVADAILMARTFEQLDFQPQAVVAQGVGFTEASFLETVGAQGEFILSREVFAADLAENKSIIKTVSDMFQERFGHTMEGATARSFTATLVLADAINRAGSTEPEAIRQALLATDIPGDQLIMPWPGVKFDPETGQNIAGSGIVVQAQEGQYYTVWPFDLATKDVIWPFPGWGER